jgi:hypothetical protein
MTPEMDNGIPHSTLRRGPARFCPFLNEHWNPLPLDT